MIFESMGRRLAQILSETADVSEREYTEALEASAKRGGSFGEALVERGLVSETQLLEAQGILYDLPVWPRLPMDAIGNDFTRQLPIQFLKQHVMVPLNVSLADLNPGEGEAGGGRSWAIAINDPANFQAMDDLARILDLEDFLVALAAKNAIMSAINVSYDLNRRSAERLVQDMEESGGAIISEIEEKADLLDDISDAPIIKLVNHIISQSVKARSSDIHIEPSEDHFKVRYRVDGILYDLLTPPKWIQPALISRIKVMAELDIAEKRLPQDGRMGIKLGDRDIDVRVSTIPTTFGERVVLRLLDKSSSLLTISELGLAPDLLKRVGRLVKSPNGVILVTGPTGSGKTTSLYAILSAINTPDINIITIEDPVEYKIKGISQIQANPKIDLTFAKGLRSIVRQDPDVILVGEIRDRETAEIAVQSSLTGHLVFSTLHTNDSASAITRLVDLGIEPFLISSSVIVVIAQRLVRVLCDACKEPFAPDEAALESLDISEGEIAGRMLYRARGCPECFQTGYRGRIGVFEAMLLDESLKSLILKTHDANQIKAAALEQRMTTLRQDGIQKIVDGITTMEEVLRVTKD